MNFVTVRDNCVDYNHGLTVFVFGLFTLRTFFTEFGNITSHAGLGNVLLSILKILNTSHRGCRDNSRAVVALLYFLLVFEDFCCNHNTFWEFGQCTLSLYLTIAYRLVSKYICYANNLLLRLSLVNLTNCMFIMHSIAYAYYAVCLRHAKFCPSVKKALRTDDQKRLCPNSNSNGRTKLNLSKLDFERMDKITFVRTQFRTDFL